MERSQSNVIYITDIPCVCLILVVSGRLLNRILCFILMFLFCFVLEILSCF